MAVSGLIKVACENCGKKYGIDPKHITDKNTKLKCLNCQNDVIIGQYEVKSEAPSVSLPGWVEEVDDISMPTRHVTDTSLMDDDIESSTTDEHPDEQIDQLAADLLGGEDGDAEMSFESAISSEFNEDFELPDWDIAETDEPPASSISTADELFDSLDSEMPDEPDSGAGTITLPDRMLQSDDDPIADGMVESDDQPAPLFDLPDWSLTPESTSDGGAQTAVAGQEPIVIDMPDWALQSDNDALAVTGDDSTREFVVDLPDWSIRKADAEPEVFDDIEFSEEKTGEMDDLADALSDWDTDGVSDSDAMDWVSDSEPETGSESDWVEEVAPETGSESDWVEEVAPETGSEPDWVEEVASENDPGADWYEEVEPGTEAGSDLIQTLDSAETDKDDEIDLEALITQLETGEESLPDAAPDVSFTEPAYEEIEAVPLAQLPAQEADGRGFTLKFLYIVVIPFIIISTISIWYINRKTVEFHALSIAQSNNAVKSIGEGLINPITETTARQARQYLMEHPELTGENMNGDSSFRTITVQDIGRTGNTFVYQTDVVDGKWWIRASKEPDLVGKEFEALRVLLRSDYDKFRELATSVKKGRPTRGYLTWPDASGVLRDVYLVCHPIGGTPYAVGAMIFTNELSSSVNKIERNSRKTLGTLRIYFSVIIGGGLFVIVLLSYFFMRFIATRRQR